MSLSETAGGDIAESFCVTLASGERAFVKHYPLTNDTHETAQSVCPSPAEAEVYGLEWLRSANALPVANVIAAGKTWLALDWIESAPPAPSYSERLGAGLAHLHQCAPDHFGLDHTNWIGRIPQRNAALTPLDERSVENQSLTWAQFYGEQRIQPLIQRARHSGGLTSRLSVSLERLSDALEGLVGPPERPSRLHGDLWAGNVITNEQGEPCLIDPAVYGGHREVDLAMMRLFGGFDPNVFEIYNEIAPLAEGAEERIALYQVYPLLVHVCLFGASYCDRLERSVDKALRGRA